MLKLKEYLHFKTSLFYASKLLGLLTAKPYESGCVIHVEGKMEWKQEASKGLKLSAWPAAAL